jgi:hypothetical protein
MNTDKIALNKNPRKSALCRGNKFRRINLGVNIRSKKWEKAVRMTIL